MSVGRDMKGAFSLALALLERTAPPAPRPATPTRPAWGSPDAECQTCGDTFKVGNPGYEVPCPSCVIEQAPTCRVCSGSGKVGAKGHRVDCPVCRASVR